MRKPSCHSGLDERYRDENGRIRAKNGTTRVDCAIPTVMISLRVFVET